MPDIFSVDNGVTTYFDYDNLTDDIRLTSVEDVTPILDAMAAKRSMDRWSKEVKEEWVHFAKIPAVVEMELAAKGIYLHDKNCTKRMMQEIQTNYPYLLSHNGKKFA